MAVLVPVVFAVEVLDLAGLVLLVFTLEVEVLVDVLDVLVALVFALEDVVLAVLELVLLLLEVLEELVVMCDVK